MGMQLVPNPWMTAEGMQRTSVDLLMPAGAPGFDELGISESELSSLEDIGERYLIRFRKMSQFVDNDEVVKTPS